MIGWIIVAYGVFVIVSLVVGVSLVISELHGKEGEKSHFKSIWLILGIAEFMFCISVVDIIYPFVLGVIYWIVYLTFIYKIWNKLFNRIKIFCSTYRGDGYKIIKMNYSDYDKVVYDIDKVCPCCEEESDKCSELKCGSKTHYLFKCPKCGTEWTGHFINQSYFK